MKKRLTASALLLSLLVSASSCTGDVPGTYEKIVLTDQCGREVTLDAPAEKVVSCYYVSSYAMLALGLEDKLVGIENKADTRPIYALSAPEVINLPAVGTMKESNTELIASLEPDLVIMPEKLSEAAETLTGLGLDVILVNPENHEDLCDMIYLIAAACGATSRAHELTGYYETQMEVLDIHTAYTEKPSVYMGGNASYLTAAPKDMYQSSLIDLAGGINAAAALEGDYWTEVSYETILSYDPDVIVIPSGADYTADDLCADAQLSALTAVKNGAVYEMPGQIEEWDSPVPSGILGAMWLASVLHPEQYTPEDFLNEAERFYETFYGFLPSEDQLS